MLRIRLMTPADIPLGVRLKAQAGWNQTEADWQRFLAMSPEGCFVAEWNGAPVGTTVACIFGSVAWIAMVLVDEPARGKGIGRALLDHALEFLDRRGIATVRLDATPLGRPLYEKLGFVAQFEVVRYAGALPHDVAAEVGMALRTVADSDHVKLFELDRSVTYTDRRAFLERLLREHPDDVRAAIADGRLAGWLALRHGSRAVQIGPCIAIGVAGQALLVDAAWRLAGQRVCVDVPRENEPAVAVVERLGLAPQRTLTRMCRGRQIVEDVGRLWASSGPELG
jgi:GNAT superfamily N-acetyltransferase